MPLVVVTPRSGWDPGAEVWGLQLQELAELTQSLDRGLLPWLSLSVSFGMCPSKGPAKLTWANSVAKVHRAAHQSPGLRTQTVYSLQLHTNYTTFWIEFLNVWERIWIMRLMFRFCSFDWCILMIWPLCTSNHGFLLLVEGELSLASLQGNKHIWYLFYLWRRSWGTQIKHGKSQKTAR